ncbi:MAG: ATP-dependent helicase [Propionibacteriaceae bacterium]|jgi:DNA helicase-2/ATP-dependent DNA helicase PcrA|nr:ATP-dependent helicase [Propionibacteriaceae bacterium]
MDQILQGLDDEQLAVATALSRPVVIVAGAGTGKTTTITRRIAYAVTSGVYAPEAVLALTFTNRAAAELRERLEMLGVNDVQARTFHSAALRQLRHFWPRVTGFALPEILSNNSELIARAIAEHGIEPTQTLLRDVGTEITWAKTSNVTWALYPERAVVTGRQVLGATPEMIANIWRTYERAKRAKVVMDFDDVLLTCAAMLHRFPEVAEEVSRSYRHFSVDEFQDVSGIQCALLLLWLGGNEDICVVGDSAQTIHTFAGADQSFLNNFTQYYPSAERFELTRNYRSRTEITALANRFAATWPDSIAAVKLVSERGDGGAVTLRGADTPNAELQQLLSWLQTLAAKGRDWNKFAVLTRTHQQLDAVYQMLQAARIPVYRKDDGDAGAYGVALVTMHSAKGLEWECVAVVGVNEGNLPHPLASTATQLAEEGRLLYVALTRACDQLLVSWVAGSGNSCSRFLAPLSE